ncbi:MAG TPA: phosphoribosylanthranilate isomerase [Anaerolineae bacterium]|nr:phosphoribosylanthranilate isomerase [Anaerolineae bacterium]HQH37789.1 phosphoribosylanthranilate isomerase [Anaerolineae bacterium]
MVYVKICGITNLEDARCAAEAGADFLGFVFYPPSPRYIAPPQAGDIIQTIRAEFGDASPRCVGVFVDASVNAVRAIIDAAGLDLAQLHGAETPAEVAALAPYAFKALRPQTLTAAQEAMQNYLTVLPCSPPSTADRLPSMPELLVDAYHPREKGGTGQTADVTIACWLAERCHLLLAGGLTPENVTDAIAQVKPWGVDVSSGVEVAKGEKDHTKVKKFLLAAKGRAH